jgi:predicted RNA-binding Zn-ribbon protein involved in translation (DUF1610 family)
MLDRSSLEKHSVPLRLAAMQEDFVTIATYFTLAEAEAVRLALEAEGIHTLATDEAISGMISPTTFGGIKLQVASADAARAEEVLAELDDEAHPASAGTEADDEGVSLKCPECGAEIWFSSERRGHVEICPECGSHVDVPE